MRYVRLLSKLPAAQASSFSFMIHLKHFSAEWLAHPRKVHLYGQSFLSQIASHQAELRIEGTFIDKRSLSISSLQTEYLNFDSRSGCGKNSERANIFHKRCTFRGGAKHSAEKCFKCIRK